MLQNLFNNSEKGQGLVEYALILVLVSVVVIVVLALVGPAISDVFCEINTKLGGTCEGGLDDGGAEGSYVDCGFHGAATLYCGEWVAACNPGPVCVPPQ